MAHYRAVTLNEDGTTGERIAVADSYLNIEDAARDEMLTRKVRRVKFEVSGDGVVWNHLEVRDLKGLPPRALA